MQNPDDRSTSRSYRPPRLDLLTRALPLAAATLYHERMSAKAIPALVLALQPTLAQDSLPDEFGEGFGHIELPQPEPEVAAGAVDVTAIEVPLDSEARALGSGIASFYGKRFHGRQTASGERFDMHAMTAAHRTLPFGSRVRVTNPSNGRSVVVIINDRGPFIAGREIDLSRAAAKELRIIARGHAPVELELLGS